MKSRAFKTIVSLVLLFICQSILFAQKPQLIVESVFTESIGSAVFSPDGRFLVTGARIEGRARYIQALLWDTKTGNILRQFDANFIYPDLDEDSGGSQFVFSRSGKYLAIFVGGVQCEPSFIFEVRTGKQISQIESCMSPNSMGFSSDETLLYAVENNSIWDEEQREGLQISENIGLNAWKTKTGKAFIPDFFDLTKVDFDNKLINTQEITEDGAENKCLTKLSFLDLNTEKPIIYESRKGNKICDFKVSGDGKTLAVVDSDKVIRIVSLKDRKEKGIIRGWKVEHSSMEFNCEFNKTGSAFACLIEKDENVNEDYQFIKVWTEKTGELQKRFPSDDFPVFKWSLDGKSFLTKFESLIKITDIQNTDLEVEFKSALPKNLFTETTTSQELVNKTILSRYDKAPINQFITPTKPANSEISLSDASGIFACMTEIKNSKTNKTFQRPICASFYSADSKKFLGETADFRVKIFDTSGNEIATFYPIGEKDWAIVDADGRFDFSEGAKSFMHYVVWGKSDHEIINFDQLKSKFHEPNLLKKILSNEPLTLTKESLKSLSNIALYPKIKLTEPTLNTRGKPCLSEKGFTLELDPQCRQFSFNLQARNGGIGKYVLRINDREVQEFQPPAAPQTSLKQEVNLENYKRYLIPDDKKTPAIEKNKIEIVAYNSEGWLPSRGSDIVYLYEESIPEKPNLWVLAVGVSDYRGDASGLRDLTFADKDAEAIANVLKIAGERLFPNQTTVKLLTSTAKNPAEISNKTNIKQILSEFNEKAKSTDVVIFYLAGHGVAYGSPPNDDFYFLTNEASRADLQDATLRETTAVSGEEIIKLLTKIPSNKQVLILDTCASGKVVEQLTKSRDDVTKNYRAWDRMKDRAGLWLLAGSTSDAVSYESSTFGQGVLTYSLLRGIKEDSDRALRKDDEGKSELLDVSTLFEYSRDEVPKLAKGIGGIQRPVIFNRTSEEKNKDKTGSFDIGRVTSSERSQIKLSKEKPAFIRTRFVIKDNQFGEDDLELTKEMNRILQLEISKGVDARIAFLQTDEKFPNAFALKANYEKKGDEVIVKAKVSQYISNGKRNLDGSEQTIEKDIDVLQVTGKAENIRGLIEEIINKTIEIVSRK